MRIQKLFPRNGRPRALSRDNPSLRPRPGTCRRCCLLSSASSLERERLRRLPACYHQHPRRHRIPGNHHNKVQKVRLQRQLSRTSIQIRTVGEGGEESKGKAGGGVRLSNASPERVVPCAPCAALMLSITYHGSSRTIPGLPFWEEPDGH